MSYEPTKSEKIIFSVVMILILFTVSYFLGYNYGRTYGRPTPDELVEYVDSYIMDTNSSLPYSQLYDGLLNSSACLTQVRQYYVNYQSMQGKMIMKAFLSQLCYGGVIQ